MRPSQLYSAASALSVPGSPARMAARRRSTWDENTNFAGRWFASEISGAIGPLVRDLLYGRADPRDDSRAADGGAFGDAASALAHVSAVIVFGREDTPGGELLVRGALLENPRATLPLPAAVRPDRLRRYAQDGAARVSWIGAESPAFALGE